MRRVDLAAGSDFDLGADFQAYEIARSALGSPLFPPGRTKTMRARSAAQVRRRCRQDT
jgi:hypothetical protein